MRAGAATHTLARCFPTCKGRQTWPRSNTTHLKTTKNTDGAWLCQRLSVLQIYFLDPCFHLKTEQPFEHGKESKSWCCNRLFEFKLTAFVKSTLSVCWLCENAAASWRCLVFQPRQQCHHKWTQQSAQIQPAKIQPPAERKGGTQNAASSGALQNVHSIRLCHSFSVHWKFTNVSVTILVFFKINIYLQLGQTWQKMLFGRVWLLLLLLT